MPYSGFEEELQLDKSFGCDGALAVMTRRINYVNGEISIKIGPGFVSDNSMVLKDGVAMPRSDAWVQECAEFVTRSLNEFLKRQEKIS